MNIEEKFLYVKKLPEYQRERIFESTVRLRAGEIPGEIMAMGKYGYMPSGWVHCFEIAFDMYQAIMESKDEK